MPNIKIGCWNIQGLFRKIDGNLKVSKLDDPDICKIINQDIICLQEVKCGPNDDVSFPGYIAHKNLRKMSHNNICYGGLVLLYKESIKKRYQSSQIL